jgi:hypothetical protein
MSTTVMRERLKDPAITIEVVIDGDDLAGRGDPV